MGFNFSQFGKSFKKHLLKIKPNLFLLIQLQKGFLENVELEVDIYNFIISIKKLDFN